MPVYKIFITLFSIFFIPALFSQQSVPLIFLDEGSTHYIFEKRVNVRNAPSLKAEKVGLALMGEPVKIVRRTEKVETLYDLEAPWYEVEWKGKSGFIWGGLISSLDLKGDFDRDGRDEILMSRAWGDGYADQYSPNFEHYDFRLCREGELITAEPFNKVVLASSQFAKVEKKGFSPEIIIVQLWWAILDGGGGAGYGELYYWSEGKFRFIERLDATLSLNDRDEIITVYPADENGKENILRLERRITRCKVKNSYEGYEYYDDEYELKDHLEEVREFLWDGKRFRKIK